MSERYQVRGRIGRGGMSAVYRAFDTVMGRDVALKRLLPVEETNLNEAAGESLAREAAALARFSHPNVVTVFAFEEDAEGPYVVMEMVEGEDLHAVMKSGALSWEDFRDVAGQCLEPLVAAADLNLLHRDIKPGNIMLTVTPSGRFLVKLLDFGLAKFSQQPSLQTLDQRGSFLGSIDFIAPEQLELRPLDQRTDLYSLGCVFYYMLVQESPFTGGSPAETSMNHIRHRCRPIGERRDDLPPLVADWIMRLIAREPGDRPTDARDALRQFQEALKGIPYQPLEDDDVPFATMAEPPSSGPAGPPPSGPVGPPTGTPVDSPPESGKAKVIRTASGPIPSEEKAPGPVTGSQLPRSQTSRQVRIPAAGRESQRGIKTGPQLTRPTGPLRPGGSGRSAPPVGPDRGLSRKWIAVAAGGIVMAVALGFLIRGGGDEEGGVKGSPEGAEAVDAVPLAPLAFPEQISSADGRPDPTALPVTDGLFARFVAAKGVFGRDYKSTPDPGGQVAAWVNLASREKERSLLRDGGDGTGEHLPIFGIYDRSVVPGLAGTIPGVTTTNRSFLTMLKHQCVLPKGCTLVAVMRIEAGDDRLFRIQPPVSDGRSVSLVTGYDGKLSAVYRGKAEGPDVRVSIPWKSGDLGILTYVWDPPGKKQRLSSHPIRVEDSASIEGPIEFAGTAFGMLAIGRRGFGDSFDTKTGNVYFEFVVYDRVLSPEEVAALVESLAARYFAPRS